ncbi:MAG TPA: hypothetical protein PK941_09130 [Paludibacter sp.]|jgi:hypothetical protein|nr:hypothetical protein [Paludibacter sp.]
MTSKDQLRKQLHQEIDALSEEDLRATKYFLDALKHENQLSLHDPATEYLATEEDIFESEDFEKGLLEAFKDHDFHTREPYKPGDKLYSLDEVFDRLTDKMSLHYGVDMRKLIKTHNTSQNVTDELIYVAPSGRPGY